MKLSCADWYNLTIRPDTQKLIQFDKGNPLTPAPQFPNETVFPMHWKRYPTNVSLAKMRPLHWDSKHIDIEERPSPLPVVTGSWTSRQFQSPLDTALQAVDNSNHELQLTHLHLSIWKVALLQLNCLIMIWYDKLSKWGVASTIYNLQGCGPHQAQSHQASHLLKLTAFSSTKRFTVWPWQGHGYGHWNVVTCIQGEMGTWGG